MKHTAFAESAQCVQPCMHKGLIGSCCQDTGMATMQMVSFVKSWVGAHSMLVSQHPAAQLFQLPGMS